MTNKPYREIPVSGPINHARSPYYALLAQIRLRAAEATWAERRRREGQEALPVVTAAGERRPR